MINKNTILTGATTLVLLAAGCHHNTQPTTTEYHGERFTEDGESTSIGRLAQAQSAAGAKADGMLHDNAFDGATLNSLGQGKLDLMVKGTAPGQPVEVYMAMPHDQMVLRQPAVAAYLQTHGVPDTLVAIAEGSNTKTTVPAAYVLPTVYKADGGGYSGAPAEMPGGGAAAGPGK